MFTDCINPPQLICGQISFVINHPICHNKSNVLSVSLGNELRSSHIGLYFIKERGGSFGVVYVTRGIVLAFVSEITLTLGSLFTGFSNTVPLVSISLQLTDIEIIPIPWKTPNPLRVITL